MRAARRRLLKLEDQLEHDPVYLAEQLEQQRQAAYLNDVKAFLRMVQ